MLIAVALVLLVLISVIFHFLSPWWFTPIASNWTQVDTTVIITFWVTGFVFVAVNLFLAYVCVRYKQKAGHKAHYEPESKKLEWILTGLTSLGVCAMLAPGLFVWASFVSVPDDAMEVEAVAEQWRWTYRLPGEDGVFGKTEASFISLENPFGINPSDPAGQDDILIDHAELRLPIDQPIKMLLRSKDVIHNFAVPQFRVKMDIVPGMVTYQWFIPTREGRYDLMCEEHCGLAHFAMRGRVVVTSREEYESWVAEQPTFAELSGLPAPNPALGRAMYAVCAACHGPEGQGNRDLDAPRITGLPAWYIHRQMNNFKFGLRGAAEGDIAGLQMGAIMNAVPDQATMRNLSAYIASLPHQPSPRTVDGNIERGRWLYTSCAGCHGRDGMGIWSQQGVRLAGMDDWYLVEQLNKFKSGMRGYHPQDFQGNQMTLLSLTLTNERAIRDVVAYINTLAPNPGN